MRDPAVTFVVILIIGILAGIIFDRVAGPGWLTRQIAGSTRGLVTSSLIGIAGAFIGYHLLALANAGGYVPFIGAIVGAALILWVWRIIQMKKARRVAPGFCVALDIVPQTSGLLYRRQDPFAAA